MNEMTEEWYQNYVAQLQKIPDSQEREAALAEAARMWQAELQRREQLQSLTELTVD